jgi:hypothetical protein
MKKEDIKDALMTVGAMALPCPLIERWDKKVFRQKDKKDR